MPSEVEPLSHESGDYCTWAPGGLTGKTPHWSLVSPGRFLLSYVTGQWCNERLDQLLIDGPDPLSLTIVSVGSIVSFRTICSVGLVIEASRNEGWRGNLHQIYLWKCSSHSSASKCVVRLRSPSRLGQQEGDAGGEPPDGRIKIQIKVELKIHNDGRANFAENSIS